MPEGDMASMAQGAGNNSSDFVSFEHDGPHNPDTELPRIVAYAIR